MAVVCPMMWRHRTELESIGANHYRYRCLCGWRSVTAPARTPNLPLEGRQLRDERLRQANAHAALPTMFIRFEIISAIYDADRVAHRTPPLPFAC